MATTVSCTTDRVLGIDDYLERIRRDVDLRDVDSVVESATLLRALANDRALVVKRLNQLVEKAFSGVSLPSAQSIVLGRAESFYVRANIWPANSDMANGRAYQNQFAYNLAHDHNFTFMTLNYLGPGYETEIYEYDYQATKGYVGEPVALEFLEKVKFTTGSAMVYRAGRDVHIQYAPEELTVTLNLMIPDPQQAVRDQYYFDVVKKIISGHPDDVLATRRVSLITLAGYLGDANTEQLLSDLAAQHPCRRTRLAAYESLNRTQPAQSFRIWQQASRDKSAMVSEAAADRLRQLEQSQ